MTRAQTLGLVALGAGALVLASAKPAKAKRRGSWSPDPGGGWSDRHAPGRIRELAGAVIEVTGWTGLDDFLVAKAWTESRGNPTACAGSCSKNAARGWFQLRPKSARVDDVGGSSAVLFDEGWAVVLASWYAYRLRPYADPGQQIDWLALARGWALPRLVADIDHSAEVKGYAPGERSDDALERFEQGCDAAGVDPLVFPYERAFPSQFEWPGLEVVASAVGVRPAGSIGRRVRRGAIGSAGSRARPSAERMAA